ncbi:MAG TPA: MetQ/NlpA family ABC transporter substrate-binding protein [Firmicutes bacterium]|nr:MetQ/NlpA family ABC transporter substrate-binding protein [Bacillales bacterium]HJA41042.1 MetQ/NlpA family ABC transporter substrate-binding protein [Bacillota bacterium]
MGKNIKWGLFVIFVFIFVIAGCGNGQTEQNQGSTQNNTAEGNQKPVVLKIGASTTPHAEILAYIKPALAAEGVDLQITEYADYPLQNQALAEGTIDANFFQHIQYMEQFEAERNVDFDILTRVHIEPMGIYSEKLNRLDDLKDGAQVSIPNDATNGGRALLLLQTAGLIQLKDDVGNAATVRDITENPKNLKIVELEAPMIPRSLDSVDLAVLNTNYALEAGMNPKEDALVYEGSETPYVNIVAIRAGEGNNETLQKLNDALLTDDVRKFIEDTFKGAVIPVF